MVGLQEEVKQWLDSGVSIEIIEQRLGERGILERDVDKVLSKIMKKVKRNTKKDHTRVLFFKELFDRIAYGIGSHQFVNVIFMLSGASYFLIGITDGIREIISSFFGSYLNHYSAKHWVSRKIIGITGILFGFCFVLMGIARYLKSTWMFMFAILMATIGVVGHGEFYSRLQKRVPKEKGWAKYMYKHGILITALSMLISAVILDRISFLNFWGYHLNSYILVFGIAALCFIISGIVISFFNEKDLDLEEHPEIFGKFFKTTMSNAKIIFKNRLVVLLVIAATISGFVQVIGNSFYGIYIFQTFRNIGFGSFANIAVVFVLSLSGSMITPLITRQISKEYGKFPMLIFGTMLTAIMPMAYYYNPNLLSIGVGTIIGVIGSAIVGIAQGFLADEIIHHQLKESYFRMHGIITVIPYLITVPVGAFIAQNLGLNKLFLILSLTLVCLVVPVYFIVMVILEKRNKKKHNLRGVNTTQVF
ncbi:MAG: hypothetical protein MAG795_00642 [Candidatus Woesearchaeota archaeon]|nr:hypothetical protein [Candidatus Woesearchaeota archaeon]